MAFAFRWRSQTGTHRDDNRDHGGIGLREDGALCIILDGATSGRESGDLARRLATEIVDWFVGREVPPTPETIIEHMRVLHAVLFERHAQGSVSYLIVSLKASGGGLALHAGDCLLGRQEGERIVWLCQPHTLVNALVERPITSISAEPGRHLLFRSFRHREFMVPDLFEVANEPGLILATDDFWADCSAVDQGAFIQGAELNCPETPDDRSCLLVWRIPEGQDAGVPESLATLYVRSRTSGD